jgi:hypothetical protein
MDSESFTKTKNEEDKQEEAGDNISTFRNVFFTTRLRRSSVHFDKIDRFLIWCEFGIVLPCGILFWIILYIFGI